MRVFISVLKVYFICKPSPKMALHEDANKSRSNEEYAMEESGDETNISNSYDPHAFRTCKNPTTNIEGTILILKACVGTGILAIPEAISHVGLLGGTILTIIVGVLITYCLHMLVRCQYEMCKWLRVPLLDYPESMKVALEHGPPTFRPLARGSGLAVDFCLVGYQLGMCSIYLLFVAKNLEQFVNQWCEIDHRLLLTLSIVPLIFTSFVKDIKLISPLAQVANILTVISLVIAMYLILQSLPPLSSVPMVVNTPSSYVRFFSAALFSISATGVVVSVERSLKRPASFTKPLGVLNISMTIVIILFATVGFFGFLKYGKTVQGSITLNLSQTSLLANIVKLLFALAIFLTYPLQFFIAMEVILRYVNSSKELSNNPVRFENVLKAALAIGTYSAALLIPMLEVFISLVGALCLSSLGIVFPSAMEICVLYSQNKLKFFSFIKNMIIFMIGITCLIVGTYLSVIDIVSLFLGSLRD